MTIVTLGMAKPLDKVKNIRSLGEAITRGGQAISAYRDQRLGGPNVPSDYDLENLVDRKQFGRAPVIAESLWRRFFKNGDTTFFIPFRDQASTTARFKKTFRGPACTRFINAAESIVEGRIDLLG